MQNKSWALLLTLAIIWGSSFFLIKLGLELFAPLQLALLRVAIAAACLLPFAFRNRSTNALPWIALAAIGLIGNVIPALLFAAAQQTIPSAVAGMLNSLQPLFTVAIAFLAFRHSIPLTKVWGILTGLIGSLILLTSNFDSSNFIDYLQQGLLIVLATFCYGLATNLIRHYCHRISPVTITATSLGIYLIPCLIGLLLLDVQQTVTANTSPWTPLISVVLLGSVGTALALVFFNRLIQLSGPVFASTVTYLIPIVAILWGVLDNEPLGIQQFLGMMIVFIGLKLSSNPVRTEKSPLTKTIDTTGAPPK